MTDKQFMFCVQEAQNYTDRDAYTSDLCLSSVWGDAEGDQIPEERIEAVGSIFDAVHRSVKEIAADAGLSNRKLAEHFCIPYVTMEKWSSGKRESPPYVRLMMQECLGLLNR